MKLAAAALTAKCVPVRALSAVAPELVEPIALDADRYDYLDLNNWGKVRYSTPPFWFGMPYWMVAPEHISDTYAGIPRTGLSEHPAFVPHADLLRFHPTGAEGEEPLLRDGPRHIIQRGLAAFRERLLGRRDDRVLEELLD